MVGARNFRTITTLGSRSRRFDSKFARIQGFEGGSVWDLRRTSRLFWGLSRGESALQIQKMNWFWFHRDFGSATVYQLLHENCALMQWQCTRLRGWRESPCLSPGQNWPIHGTVDPSDVPAGNKEAKTSCSGQPLLPPLKSWLRVAASRWLLATSPAWAGRQVLPVIPGSRLRDGSIARDRAQSRAWFLWTRLRLFGTKPPPPQRNYI